MLENQQLASVILAAGQGKRMKSDLPKVLHTVGNKRLIEHVIEQARGVNADPVIVVVGQGREQVIPVVRAAGVEYVIQEEQLGTGHAMRMTEERLKDYKGNVLVLSGDVPLLKRETLQKIIEYHLQQEAVATMITAFAPDPEGYGRVLRDESGRVFAIREHKDCNEKELAINEINAAIYVFRTGLMFDALRTVNNDNVQAEYYLPDVFHRYFAEGRKVAAMPADFGEIHGINTREELEQARKIFEKRPITA